jgi:hypothetical protein
MSTEQDDEREGLEQNDRDASRQGCTGEDACDWCGWVDLCQVEYED